MMKENTQENTRILAQVPYGCPCPFCGTGPSSVMGWHDRLCTACGAMAFVLNGFITWTKI